MSDASSREQLCLSVVQVSVHLKPFIPHGGRSLSREESIALSTSADTKKETKETEKEILKSCGEKDSFSDREQNTKSCYNY